VNGKAKKFSFRHRRRNFSQNANAKSIESSKSARLFRLASALLLIQIKNSLLSALIGGKNFSGIAFDLVTKSLKIAK
jgi:hypothetical protein